MKPSLIVSLTSYPARIHTVEGVLKSIYQQDLKPDRVMLYLAEEEFPDKEKQLPKPLLDDIADDKLTLRWCDDLGSHKKYFYAMQEFPDDIIVTIDDTKYYPRDTLRTLYRSYEKYPHAVSALYTTLITFGEDKKPLLPDQWLKNYIGLIDAPSMQLMAVGNGGILYPPHLMDQRLFDKNAIYRFCRALDGRLRYDDRWLKIHQLLAGTPVVHAPGYYYHDCTVFGNYSLNTRTSEQFYMLLDYYNNDKNKDVLNGHFKEIVIDASFTDILGEAGASLILEHGRSYILREYMAIREGHRAGFKNQTISWIPYSVRQAFMIHAWVQSCGFGGIVEKNIPRLQKMITETWNLIGRTEQCPEISALLEYGCIVLGGLEGIFRRAPDYMQMLKNWEELFLRGTDNRTIYADCYRQFLKDMMNFLR